MTGTLPLVVVGVVTYNRPAGLKRMVLSLLAQTYANVRIIVCDNASVTPETAEVMAAFVKEYPEHIVYKRHPQNLGMTGNFRSAYEAAGELGADYFLWASDDDFFHPTYIEHCLALMAGKPDVSAAIASAQMTNNSDVPMYKYPGFSRFTNRGIPVGSLRRWLYLWWFLFDPIVYGKGTLPYLLFKYPAMREMMENFSDVQLKLWGGDNAMLYMFLKRHDIVGSDAILMDKNFPTERTHLWFPLAWSYQPLPKHIKHTYLLFKEVAETPAEKLQIAGYVVALVVFWMTIGYPLKGVSYALRLWDNKWPLVQRHTCARGIE